MKRYNNAHIGDYPVLWRHLLKVARYSFSRERWQNADANLIDANFRADDQIRRIHAPRTLHPSQTLVSVLGHSTVLLRRHDFNILIDPVWASCAGPFGLIGPRRQRPMPPLSSLPRIDLILISHDHYDHLDLGALQMLCRQHNPLILTGLGLGRLIRNRIASARVVELGWWGTYVHEGHRFTFVPAQHFSGRSLWMNNTLWGGFIGEIAGETFYYVGDSGYQEKIVKAIAKRFHCIDLALIPVGSYEPYEHLSTYHLSPQDAVRMFAEIPIRKAFAVHFATFRLSIENAERQVKDFLAARQQLEERAHDFILPVFGADYLVEGKR